MTEVTNTLITSEQFDTNKGFNLNMFKDEPEKNEAIRQGLMALRAPMFTENSLDNCFVRIYQGKHELVKTQYEGKFSEKPWSLAEFNSQVLKEPPKAWIAVFATSTESTIVAFSNTEYKAGDSDYCPDKDAFLAALVKNGDKYKLEVIFVSPTKHLNAVLYGTNWMTFGNSCSSNHCCNSLLIRDGCNTTEMNYAVTASEGCYPHKDTHFLNNNKGMHFTVKEFEFFKYIGGKSS